MLTPAISVGQVDQLLGRSCRVRREVRAAWASALPAVATAAASW